MEPAAPSAGKGFGSLRRVVDLFSKWGRIGELEDGAFAEGDEGWCAVWGGPSGEVLKDGILAGSNLAPKQCQFPRRARIQQTARDLARSE